MVFLISDWKWKFALTPYDKFFNCFHTGIIQRILCRAQSFPKSSSYNYTSFLHKELQKAVYLAFVSPILQYNSLKLDFPFMSLVTAARTEKEAKGSALCNSFFFFTFLSDKRRDHPSITTTTKAT